jgi:hypothetical protein
MKIYFAAFVWGEKYIKDFLEITLPAQFSESNILALKEDIRYVFYINKNEKKFFNVKIINDLISFCTVSFEFVDDISTSSDKYNKLGLIQNKAIVTAINDGFEVFFPIYSDLIFSSNAIPFTVEKLKYGKYFVFSMSPQVIRKQLVSYIQSKKKESNRGFDLDPIEMTKFVLANLHPIRAPSVFRDGEFKSFPSVFFLDTQEGYIGKAFHLHPVAFRITKDKILMNKFIGTLDEHFIPLLIDRIELAHVIVNTADMCLCSFDELDNNIQFDERPHKMLADRRKITNIAERHASKIHRQFFEKNIYFNTTEIGKEISNKLYSELDQFSNSLLRDLLISDNRLKVFNYETYLKRNEFTSLKIRSLEYQIQQSKNLIIYALLWNMNNLLRKYIKLMKLEPAGVFIREKVLNLKSRPIQAYSSILFINKIYGAEVIEYIKGKSIFYLIYIKMKFIKKSY